MGKLFNLYNFRKILTAGYLDFPFGLAPTNNVLSIAAFLIFFDNDWLLTQQTELPDYDPYLWVILLRRKDLVREITLTLVVIGNTIEFPNRNRQSEILQLLVLALCVFRDRKWLRSQMFWNIQNLTSVDDVSSLVLITTILGTPDSIVLRSRRNPPKNGTTCVRQENIRTSKIDNEIPKCDKPLPK